MKALKGLLIYIGIVLGVLTGIALVLLCIMYFVPSFRLFGVGLVHYNEKTEVEEVVLSDYQNYEDISINVTSNKIDINIVPAEVENIKYNMHLKIFGVSTEIIEYEIIKEVLVVDNTLQLFLNITEPNGWISTSDSSITVYVPQMLEVGLVTSTTSGEIVIGSSKADMKINSLLASTGRGDLMLTGIAKGEETKEFRLKNLQLKTDDGEFNLQSIDNIYVENVVKLESDRGDFKFNNLFASVEITGDGVELHAKTIETGEEGFSCITQSGHIYVDVITLEYIEASDSYVSAEHTFIAENLYLDVNEIIGKTAVVTTYGDIIVDILNDYTYIEDKEGAVTIGVAKNTIIVTTVMGDISVESYYASAEFSSDKGDITVNSRGEYKKGVHTKIRNVDGDINIYNRANRLILNTTGRSKVKVEFLEILTFDNINDVFEHSLKVSDKGSCTVYIPTTGEHVKYFKFYATGLIGGDYRAKNGVQYAPSEPTNQSDIQQANCTVHFSFDGRIDILGYSPV